uniref:Uncharacterized protein n=2 Tax=Tetranychus urticae TaxID=32264 RepID=T1JYE4_TETUR
MIKQTFTLILLITTVSLARSASDNEESTFYVDAFKEVCSLRTKEIKDGNFDKAIKATSDCREKLLSKDELAAISKCEIILPMIKADEVTKICNDMNGSLDKFTEQIKCNKQAAGDKINKFGECYVAFQRSVAG